MNTLPQHDWQPNRQTPQTQGLNRPMAWIGVMLLAMLVAVGLARWSGLDPRTPDAAVQWQRDLQFRDLPSGDIAVVDHRSGQQVAQFSGEQGFLRSTLRALARERQRESSSNTGRKTEQRHHFSVILSCGLNAAGHWPTIREWLASRPIMAVTYCFVSRILGIPPARSTRPGPAL